MPALLRTVLFLGLDVEDLVRFHPQLGTPLHHLLPARPLRIEGRVMREHERIIVLSTFHGHTDEVVVGVRRHIVRKLLLRSAFQMKRLLSICAHAVGDRIKAQDLVLREVPEPTVMQLLAEVEVAQNVLISRHSF